MKKLMLSALVAVMALASCNKQDNAPVNNRLRSVDVAIGNKIVTKGLAGDKINAGQAVQVNDIKIYLTDGAGNVYSATEVDGVTPSQVYFTGAEVAAGIQTQFHYVDPACTKIIAVANVGDVDLATAKAMTLAVENQQDQKTLALYAEEDLVATGRVHNDTADDGITYVADVYEAELTLMPRVSRFEVDGFAVKFNAEPKYEEIHITQLAFQNYYPTTALATGVETGTLVAHIPDFTKQADVYAWLNNGETGWYRDAIDVTITPAENVKDIAAPLAYHVFSGAAVPVFVIQLTADGQPAYLYSKGFYKNVDGTATAITEFEEGKIYRMSAAGEVLGDGNLPFDEDDIDPMDRCLEITVGVHDWIVELVYPEF